LTDASLYGGITMGFGWRTDGAPQKFLATKDQKQIVFDVYMAKTITSFRQQ